MKNFRKVLALVLVVAMMFSFTAMSSAAYKDISKVSYKEAVDVLSAIGILNGYEVAKDEYEFQPTAEIDRDEMAKMVAVLANAGSDVSKLYAVGSKFADVTSSHWAASYVAYCVEEGIVAGRSATTFDPDASVTALETAKMLLVMLGFSAEEQGYVNNANWKVAVLEDAKLMGLFNGFPAGYNPDANITRELAAQMMLNALQAPCVVGILSDGIVTVTNALIVEWAGLTNLDKLMTVTAWSTLKNAIENGKWCLYGNVVISNDPLVDRLFPTLKVVEDDADCFGRPAISWTYTDALKNVTEMGPYAATPVWTSTKATTKNIADVLDDYAKIDATADVIRNGQTVSDYEGGNGRLVEIYFVDGELTVVEIDTYLGFVGQLNTATTKVEIVDADGKEIATIKNTYGFTHKDTGAAVIFNACEEHIHNLKAVEAETITLHGNRNAAGYFCDKAENKYEYNVLAEKKVANTDLGKSIDVYLDFYGYVLNWAPAKGAAKQVAVLVSDSALAFDPVYSANDPVAYTYTAEFVDFDDAAAVKVNVDRQTYDVDKDATSDVLVTYTASGEKRVKASTEGVVTAEGTGYVLNKASGLIDGLTGIAGNNDTQYILRVFNYMTGKYEYKYFDGKAEIDANYKLDNLQYITTNYNALAPKQYLAYVYAEAQYVETSGLAFILKFVTDEAFYTDGKKVVEYDLYKAIVNGEEAYVAYEEAEGVEKLANKMYTSTYQKIGVESHDGLAIYVATETALETAGKNFYIEGDTIVYEDKSGNLAANDMADGATITVVTLVKGKYSIKTVSYDELVNYAEFHGWTTYSWMKTSSKGVTELFIFAEPTPETTPAV